MASLVYAAVFWAGLCLLIWTWAGYPVALTLFGWMAVRLGKRESQQDSGRPAMALPSITMIIPVFNAESALPAKLQNCVGLSYPSERFEILVTSDGSSDRSAEIAWQFSSRHPNVRLVESAGRVGKSAAQNLATSVAKGEILLLTDVDTILAPEALQSVARSFRHPEVGCVTGHVVWSAEHNAERAHSDNLYWRFEHYIWGRESTLGLLACASGPCMALRSRLFRDIDPRYGDDVVLPLDVVQQGFRVAYDPALLALERSSERPAEVLRARARMTLRSLRGTLSRRAVFSPVRRPVLCVAVLSHKLLRWATPFLFLLVLASAVPLAIRGQAAAGTALGLQCTGLAAALAGHVAYRMDVRIPVVAAAHDFALDNLGILIGVTWAVVGRSAVMFR
jgi:cellulose synthase/poly-beta-1,6-N-acetylglucosamine synthase-like glycosyltransferase